MNREIKFRIWDNILKKHHIWAGLSWYFNIDSVNKIISLKNTNNFEDWIPQQFTGRKDKNDKEIYDGDLILGDGYGPYRIFWNDDMGGWCSCCYSDAELISTYKTIEIVGHIFDGTVYEGVL